MIERIKLRAGSGGASSTRWDGKRHRFNTVVDRLHFLGGGRTRGGGCQVQLVSSVECFVLEHLFFSALYS